MRHWISLADQWDRLCGDKHNTIIGYEIAGHFIPPHDVLNRSYHLSVMLALCVKVGQTFQKKAAELLITAFQMNIFESQASITLNEWNNERTNERTSEQASERTNERM